MDLPQILTGSISGFVVEMLNSRSAMRIAFYSAPGNQPNGVPLLLAKAMFFAAATAAT
jgi:hypothetical protein